MSIFLYNIFLFLFRAGTFLAAPFNSKARHWIRGRRNLMRRLRNGIPSSARVIWIHCASLGEFEQGRPLIEALKKQFPAYKILLTFFSPSGYEAKKNYSGADWIDYLPMDGPARARQFLEIVHPSLVIFVKYEFWYYYLKKIKHRGIPLLLVAALFRKDMSFFAWYGGLQQKMLARFDRLFVQNESSQSLLERIGLSGITEVSGDTRFDRVIEIAEKFTAIDMIEEFLAGEPALVAGSSWAGDEEVIAEAIRQTALRLIIAPHEITKKHISSLLELFPEALLYSDLTAQPGTTRIDHSRRVLIIDNIGMLSRLYKYGTFTYVGGGFQESGVHNVLEAAVYGKPVYCGPFYKKYSEAIGLVAAGGGFPVKNSGELRQRIEELQRDQKRYGEACRAAAGFVKQHAGATEKILRYISENKLL